MIKIVITNNKGGVGKTTIASQIAFALAERGYSILAVDFDSQCNFSSSLENATHIGNVIDIASNEDALAVSLEAGEIGLIKGDKNLNDISGDELLTNIPGSLNISKGADFCIMDTPPSFSGLVYGAMLAADHLLIPIELKKYSIDGIEGALEAYYKIQTVNEDLNLLGIIPSRYDAVKKSEREAFEKVQSVFASVVTPCSINNRTAYETAQSNG